MFVDGVVLLVVTDSGVQPEFVFNMKLGTKGCSMQIVLVSISNPHLFPVLIVTVYIPAEVKFTHKLFEPDNHKLESADEKSFPNELLPTNVYPIEGDIDHTIPGLEHVLLIT
jgi:hypothetical protein